MAKSGRHPKKEIQKALAGLDDSFTVEEFHRSHRWGRVICHTCGASFSIWSTPKVPEHHARDLRSFATKHRHTGGTQ